MSKIDIKNIKKLREETSASVLDVKKALEEAGGDFEKAKEALIERGKAIAAKKTAERTVGAGLIHSYIHTGGNIGSMIQLECETDFVAKTDEFKDLAQEIAMQAAIKDYFDVGELLEDEYIRDPSKKVSELVTEAIAKTGEKIVLSKTARFSI
ncbi:translation elongation factor Ts [candidate division WWE3 bacterium]|nr:translation elongation factor Ts [candidate division WWE3 bacterium]